MYEYKKLIIFAMVFIVLGTIICVISFGAIGFDFDKINNVNLETNEYEITDNFDDINIEGNSELFDIEMSQDGKCSVICKEEEDKPHEVRVENNKLIIKPSSNNKWKFNLLPTNPKVTVFLPEKKYRNLIVKSDTGGVKVKDNLSFEDINIELDVGYIDLSASSLNSVVLNNDIGEIDLHNVVTDKMSINNDIGDVTFDRCDAKNINVELSDGDVEGTLLSDKNFDVQTNDGKVDVPEGKEGGLCNIKVDSGDIKITIDVN